MQKAPPTPKGFRDIKPDLASQKRSIINQIINVLEKAGFVPIETPTIEFAQTLKGKYGEEERLIYEFEDRGGRELALRYDLTVPLARYVATYHPPFPFRRYQIGQVFRGENPQKGRFREFTQLDFDSVGLNTPEEDALIIATALQAIRQVNNQRIIMAVNDRQNFENVPPLVIRAFDKIHKIGKAGVEKELINKGFKPNKVTSYLEKLLNAKETPRLKAIFAILRTQGFTKDEDFFFDTSLARGLDYYTGPIFELKLKSDPRLSYGGGGRYDNLIGIFAKRPIPAVGFSLGIDRLCDLLQTSQKP